MIPNVRVAIYTAPHPDGTYKYLGETMRSLFESEASLAPEQVAVFTDAREPPPNMPAGIHVEARTARHMTMLAIEDDPIYAASLNMVRCLEWAGQAAEYGVTLEHDLLFDPHWLTRGYRLAHALSCRIGGRFILNMRDWLKPGTGTDPLEQVLSLGRDEFDKNGERIQYDDVAKWNQTVPVWGAQTLLMHNRVMRDLAADMERGLWLPRARRATWYTDSGVMMFSQSRNVPIYAMRPSPITHVGDESAARPGLKWSEWVRQRDGKG